MRVVENNPRNGAGRVENNYKRLVAEWFRVVFCFVLLRFSDPVIAGAIREIYRADFQPYE